MAKNLFSTVVVILLILFGCTTQPAQAQGPPPIALTPGELAIMAEVQQLRKELKAEAVAIRGEMKAGFKKLNQRLDGVDTRLANLEVGQAEIRAELKTLGIKIDAVDAKAEKALTQLAIVLTNQEKASAERTKLLEGQAFLQGQLSVLKDRDRPTCVSPTVVINTVPTTCQVQNVQPCGYYRTAIPYGWSWYQGWSGGAYRLYRNPITGSVSYDYYAASSSTETIVY